MLLEVAGSTSQAFGLTLSYVIGVSVFLVVLARVATLSGGGDRDSRRSTAGVAVLAWLVGVGLWLDAGRPGGLTGNDPLLAEAGAVCIGLGVVLAAAASLGWSPVGDRTAWWVVALGTTGLAGLEVLVVLWGPLPVAPPELALGLGLALAAAVVATLAGVTRPTALDGARHGVLVAGGATLVLLWRLAYEVSTPSAPFDVVWTVGVVVPGVACFVGVVGGALGGTVAARRRGRASRT